MPLLEVEGLQVEFTTDEGRVRAVTPWGLSASPAAARV
jgi:ABC-type antimicrobial peptide transport system ATPase subunit